VVRKNERPDRPDSELEQKVGLSNKIWETIEAAWRKEVRLRPSFSQIVQVWRGVSTPALLDNIRPTSPASSITGEEA
jgi:hypothetical protein